MCVRTSTLLTCFGVLSESLSMITVSLLCDSMRMRCFGDEAVGSSGIGSSSIVTTIDISLPFFNGLLSSESGIVKYWILDTNSYKEDKKVE